MDLTLRRTEAKSSGVFSELLDDSGEVIASCLEHAYPDGDGWGAKIPPGVYTCNRSMHRLHGMNHDFETFEITGVTGHSGLLFHWGNYNKDSDGCVLLGRDRVGDMVTDSRATFCTFMNLQTGNPTFQLTVT